MKSALPKRVILALIFSSQILLVIYTQYSKHNNPLWKNTKQKDTREKKYPAQIADSNKKNTRNKKNVMFYATIYCPICYV